MAQIGSAAPSPPVAILLVFGLGRLPHAMIISLYVLHYFNYVWYSKHVTHSLCSSRPHISSLDCSAASPILAVDMTARTIRSLVLIAHQSWWCSHIQLFARSLGNLFSCSARCPQVGALAPIGLVSPRGKWAIGSPVGPHAIILINK